MMKGTPPSPLTSITSILNWSVVVVVVVVVVRGGGGGVVVLLDEAFLW